MPRCDAKNIAVEWLDAYEAGSLDLIVAMHSSAAVIECACGEAPKKIHGPKDVSDYGRHRLTESPALGLEVLKVDEGVATICYRTSQGIVHAALDVSEDGLITRCRCGPAGQVKAKIDWLYVLSLAGLAMTRLAYCCSRCSR